MSLEDPTRAVDAFLSDLGLEDKSPSDKFVLSAFTHTGDEQRFEVGSYTELRQTLIRNIDRMMEELAGVTIQTVEDYTQAALAERDGATIH